MGVGSVDVVLHKGTRNVTREDGSEFTAAVTKKTNWSGGTFVHLDEEDGMTDVVEDDDSVDETPKKAKKAKANGKASAATGKRKTKDAAKDSLCIVTGAPTRGRFAPGMDARYYSQLRKFVRGDFKESEFSKYARAHLKTVNSDLVKAAKSELKDHGISIA